MYSSLMQILQTHHSLDANNVNADKLHEIGSCPHLIMQDFNPTLSFLLHIFPLPSHSISVVRTWCPIWAHTPVQWVMWYPFHRVLLLGPPDTSCHHHPCLCCVSTSCHTPAATRHPSQVQLHLLHCHWLWMFSLLSRGATAPPPRQPGVPIALLPPLNYSLRWGPPGKKHQLISSGTAVLFTYSQH